MRTPQGRTQDGFERQLGVHFLSHFALTTRPMPLLEAAPDAWVVTVSSTEHKNGRIDFDDLQLDGSDTPRKAYQQSKFATIVFGIELDRRLRAATSPSSAS
jgi:NAD(P)-dependent dehydrogenase (short-subunit alcohol dehydrogenase family)